MMQPDFNFDFNLDDFSTEAISIEDTFQTRYVKPPRTLMIEDNCMTYEKAQALAKDLVLDKGCRYYVVVNGSFFAGDLIEALVVEHDLPVKKLSISTLSLNENNVDSLANLVNGGFVDELNLIVSDYFYSHERHNLIPYIYQELDKDNKFQLAVASTHCKLCLIETHCGKKITIHGSANLRSSSNIEQLAIEEDAIRYDFNDRIQDQIIDAYKTINKSVRRVNLWQAVTKPQK
jgi:hypothetical protein